MIIVVPDNNCETDEQAGNDQSRRPAQGSRELSFLNMQKDAIEISSILQCQKYPKGYT